MRGEGTLLELISIGIGFGKKQALTKGKTFGQKPAPSYLCRPLKRRIVFETPEKKARSSKG